MYVQYLPNCLKFVVGFCVFHVCVAFAPPAVLEAEGLIAKDTTGE